MRPLQEQCSLASLNEESVILAQLIARNRSQHRRTDYHPKLVAVHRCLRHLQSLDVALRLSELAVLVQKPALKGGLSGERICLCERLCGAIRQ